VKRPQSWRFTVSAKPQAGQNTQALPIVPKLPGGIGMPARTGRND
jgi:hypothetical protein